MELSGEEDFKRVEDGLKLLALNYQRVVSKHHHLKDSVGYLEDELVMFRNSLQLVNDLFKKMKVMEVKKDEHGRSSKQNKKVDR